MGYSFVCWIFEKFCTQVINPTLPNLFQSYLYLINCGFVVCRIIQCHNVTILIFTAVHGITLLTAASSGGRQCDGAC